MTEDADTSDLTHEARAAGGSTYQDTLRAAGGANGQQLKGYNGVEPRSGKNASRSIAPPLELLPRDVHGRKDIKDRLGPALTAKDGVIRVLHGIPGGGKSSLALWLAREADSQGREIYWIDNADIEQSMSAVAARLDIDLGQFGSAQGQDLVWRKLDQATTPWLMIFDNVDDVHRAGVLGRSGGELDGTGWIRPSRGGLVVVTSRNGDAGVWGQHVQLFRVSRLSDADGGRMLRELAPGAGGGAEAEELAAELGGLPLALRLAGGYLRSDPLRYTTFTEYRDAVRRNVELLDAAAPRPASLDDEDSARRSIRLTWELSLALLEERNLRPARPLLWLLTCYGAPHPIPFALLDHELLRGTPIDCGGEWSDAYLLEVARELVSSALVDKLDIVNPDGTRVAHLTLHPLLAEVIAAARDKSPSAAELWSAAVTLLAAATPAGQEPSDWARWRELPAVHAAVLRALRALPRQPTELVAVAVDKGNVCAGYLLSTGAMHASHHMTALAFDLAKELPARHLVRLNTRFGAAVVNLAQGSAAARDELRTLLADARTVLPPDSSFLVVIRQRLAVALSMANQLDEAAELYDELFADHDNGIGQDVRIATSFGYGQLMSIRGEYDIAETEIRSVLTAERELYPDDPEHPNLLTTRTVLAEVWAGQGKLMPARAELMEVLRAQERVHGPDSPLTLAARTTLMGVLAQLSDEGGVQVQLNRLLRIQRDALNPEHPLALLGMATLVNTRALNPLGDHDPRADEERLTQLATAMARTMGDDHLLVLSTRLQAAVQRCEFDSDGGLRAVREVLERQESVYSECHIATLRTKLVYAQLLASEDVDNPAAERELRDLLARQLESIGPDHPQTAVVCSSLAYITCRNGDLADGEQFLRTALASYDRLHGVDHEASRNVRSTLVKVLAERENFAAAEAELLKLVESMDRTDPETDGTLGAHLLLALVRWGDGRNDDAERDVRALLSTVERLHTERPDYDLCIARWILSDILSERGAYPEVEALLRQVLDDLVALGDPDDDVVGVRVDLGKLLHETGELAEAEHHLQLAIAQLDSTDRRMAHVRAALNAVAGELEVAPTRPALSAPAEPPTETPADSAGDTCVDESAGTEPGEPASVAAAPEDVVRRDATQDWLAYLSGAGERPESAAPQRTVGPAPTASTPPAETSVPPAPPRPSPIPVPPATSPATAHAGPDSPDLAGITACRAHGLALAEQGFPAAAHGMLCAAYAAHGRLVRAMPVVERLGYLVDLAVVRPDDGSADHPARVERLARDVAAELDAGHVLMLRLHTALAESWTRRGLARRAADTLDATLAGWSEDSRRSVEPALARMALAAARHRLGDRPGAESLWQRAIGELGTLLGADHAWVWSARAGSAATRIDVDAAAARTALRAALAGQVRTRGTGHPEVATTRHHLGMAAMTLGDRGAARAELTAAVRIRTSRLGPAHPATVASRRLLATV